MCSCGVDRPILFSEYNPPTGFSSEPVDSLSVGLQWDTTFNLGMNGYSIYAAEIPDSSYVHAGTPPPWFQPTSWTKVAETGLVDSCSVTGSRRASGTS